MNHTNTQTSNFHAAKNKQTKRTNKQANKQTNTHTHTHKQTNKQAKQTHKLVNVHSYKNNNE